MKKHLLMIVLQLASSGADAYLTNRSLQVPGSHEVNPLARVFVTHGPASVAAYFSAQTAGKLILPWELRRHGHSKLAQIAEVAGIADNAAGAAGSVVGWQSFKLRPVR